MDTPESHPDRRDPLFDALRAEMQGQDTPRGVEKELMQAFACQFPQARRWYHKLGARALAWAGGLSTAATAVVLLSLTLHAPHLATLDGDRPLVTRDGGGLFIALESPERIEQEPAPRMVATDVSRSSLAALGLPLTPENAGDTVRAEMLLGADGQPLALRLTSIE